MVQLTFRSTARDALVGSLTALSQALDALPSIGRTIRVCEPEARDEQPPEDDLVIDVGGFTVFRRGGWSSRFTLLPMIIAGLDDGRSGGVKASAAGDRPHLRAVS